MYVTDGIQTEELEQVQEQEGKNILARSIRGTGSSLSIISDVFR